MISLRQINNHVVRPIPIPSSFDTRPIKGFDLCETLYANIFLTAKKNSGKTSTIFKIMKHCSDKKTIIIIFCSTIYKDENWIAIQKYFEDRGYDIRVYTSIFEDGEDELDNLIAELSKEQEKEEEDELQYQCDVGNKRLKIYYLEMMKKRKSNVKKIKKVNIDVVST